MLGYLSSYQHLNCLCNDKICEGHLRYWKNEAKSLEKASLNHDLKTTYKILCKTGVGPKQIVASVKSWIAGWTTSGTSTTALLSLLQGVGNNSASD